MNSALGRRGFLAAATASLAQPAAAQADRLEEMGRSDRVIWNGVVLTPGPAPRIFLALPNWMGPSPGVGELGPDGVLRPWPGNGWNAWAPGGEAGRAMVSVNAVRLDPRGEELWVVDAGAPFGSQRLAGGAKILRFGVTDGSLRGVIPLDDVLEDPRAAPNDIRFSGGHAYLTESGAGSLLVLNLETGRLRRVLARHALLLGDPKRQIRMDGRPLVLPNGAPFAGHANQLEVSPDNRWLYVQPINGGLARIATRDLDDATLGADAIAARLEPWLDTPPLSGTAIDPEGNLYMNAINDCAILRASPDRRVGTVIADPRLQWADAPWLTADRWLWTPAAQLGRLPMFRGGQSAIEWPMRLFRVGV